MRFGKETWNNNGWDWAELWPTHWFRKSYPAVNVYGDEDRLLVTSEVPGLALEDLEVSVSGRTLTIKGKRSLPQLDDGECYACEERARGEFERSLGLPFDVNTSKVEAQYDRGLLTLRLPRLESSKPRKIEVRTN